MESSGSPALSGVAVKSPDIRKGAISPGPLRSDRLQGHLIWNLEKGHRAVGFSLVTSPYASPNRR